MEIKKKFILLLSQQIHVFSIRYDFELSILIVTADAVFLTVESPAWWYFVFFSMKSITANILSGSYENSM